MRRSVSRLQPARGALSRSIDRSRPSTDPRPIPRTEQRVILKYLESEGKDPATGEELTADDLIPVKANKGAYLSVFCEMTGRLASEANKGACRGLVFRVKVDQRSAASEGACVRVC